MPISRNFLKNLDKKINCVFFVDEKKTHHFKINYLFFKCLVVFFSVTTISVGFISIVSLHMLKEKKSLTGTVLNLKSYYIHNYLETRFITNTQDEIDEDLPTKVPTLLAAAPATNKPIPLAPIQSSPEITKPPLPIPSSTLKTYGVTVDKEKILLKDNKIVLSFLLLSSSKNKGKTISGAVCAVLEGVNSLGQKKILNYPSELKVDSQGLPTDSCIIGEHVKFSRLRPATFEFDSKLEALKNQKASIYFLEKNSSKPVLLKEVKYN